MAEETHSVEEPALTKNRGICGRRASRCGFVLDSLEFPREYLDCFVLCLNWLGSLRTGRCSSRVDLGRVSPDQ